MVDVAPPAPAPVAVGGCEQYQPIFAQYNWDVRVMMAIMKAENTTCDPTRNNNSAGETHYGAYGSVICVGSYGLLQVGCLHFSGSQNPNDPATNIAVGYEVWKKQGYNAWTQYKNGEYLKHL